MSQRKRITQDELKRILSYCPDTGTFMWKVNTKFGARIKGSMAGSVDKRGYRYITINKKSYQAHRLAFLYMVGYLPEGQVDHKDRVKNHNWWSNLREASPQCQARNTGISTSNTSGIRGVCWHKLKNKWEAFVKVNNVRHYLGRFSDFVEAVAHRFAAEQCLDYLDCNTNSSAGGYLREANK